MKLTEAWRDFWGINKYHVDGPGFLAGWPYRAWTRREAQSYVRFADRIHGSGSHSIKPAGRKALEEAP